MPAVRLGSSLRSKTPEQTWSVASPLMSRLGISRVTDITRMDRLGLPVFASIRPRGQVLRVHAGKGLEPGAARVGALMEAVEFAVAEPGRTDWLPQPMAVGRFLAQFQGDIDLIDFAPVMRATVAHDDVLVTAGCEDLQGNPSVQLPAELVFLPFQTEPAGAVFGWSSNGLASGNSLDEATLHALFEVLERDAVTMNRAFDESCLIDEESLPPPFDTLLAQWRLLGVRTAVRWIPCSSGVTCFQASIHEPLRASVHLTAGSGAHFDREIALSRAICEAAQSRLSHVHGGRDDIVRFFDRYAGVNEVQRAEVDDRLLHRLFDSSRSMRYDALPPGQLADADISQVLASLLGRMRKAGFDRVYRHVFNADLDGMVVVKLIVPRCEDAENNPERMGRRLLNRLTARVQS